MNLLAKLTGFTAPDFEDINDIIKFAHEPVMELVGSKVITTSQKENELYDEFFALNGVNILSFNYTSLFDILGVKSPCAYSNVHGKLCNRNCENDCESSSIIFGIDDKEMHTKNTENDLRFFSKTYRKMFDTSSPIIILPPMENNQIELKFFGHSLNKADYSYFQSIFDYYNIYGNNKIKLIFYYSQGFEQRDAIYRLINEYGTTLTNKDQGKNLMHKLLIENRLKIEKI